MATAEQGGREGDRPAAHTPPAGMPSPAQPARPRFSESQAAKLCGVSRSTIQRARTRGDIPGVERVESGWSLPLEGLLAAGFKPESGAGTPWAPPRPRACPGGFVPLPTLPALRRSKRPLLWTSTLRRFTASNSSLSKHVQRHE